MVGLIGLEKDVSFFNVTAADAADDLSEEMKSALLSGVIGKREAGVRLNDGDGGEVGEIEAASNGLGADDEVNLIVF